ncbi:MAG: Rad52/Rad22 family DNA repair protein [Paludisphaera borealis]|uniref:Rad52/Rad22 family DNA repair protein n=1 Tax=Paludisphaera borealis TaxID=1387353 RepID=UPI00283EBB2A|nr:Rad52/Rad22 family DNA repair protein [Paludisphaera borealis]MDR3622042.1 Rad52/Rad22 family DNA repair protein [Paludisphaera borealis]
MSQHIEIFAALAAPFSADEVRTRSQNGRDFQYITARMVMNRLDEVLGPVNWWDDYTPIENAIVCRLTVRLPDGTTLTKCDAGGFTTTLDTSDFEKSGFSDAFKRAAVKFGVGRYLYGDGVPPSIREALARRPTDAVQPQAQPAHAPSRPAMEVVNGTPPKTGKALFAWVKERDEKLGCELLKSLSDWGKSQDFPARMVQWNDEQVDRGHSEAVRRLGTLELAPQTSAFAQHR